MAITYPITLPTGRRRMVQFSPYSVVAMSMSPFTLQQQAQAHQGQIWVVQVALSPMQRAAAEEWIAALLSLNGRYGTFLLGDPSGATPRGSVAGAPLVKGAAQTGQELLTDGWTQSAQNVLRKGDWIQLGSGPTQRIYRCLKDVNANSSGEATLDLWPRLRESPADNASLVTTSTAGVFRLAENTMEWSVDLAAIYGIELKAVEAL